SLRGPASAPAVPSSRISSRLARKASRGLEQPFARRKTRLKPQTVRPARVYGRQRWIFPCGVPPPFGSTLRPHIHSLRPSRPASRQTPPLSKEGRRVLTNSNTHALLRRKHARRLRRIAAGSEGAVAGRRDPCLRPEGVAER